MHNELLSCCDESEFLNLFSIETGINLTIKKVQKKRHKFIAVSKDLLIRKKWSCFHENTKKARTLSFHYNFNHSHLDAVLKKLRDSINESKLFPIKIINFALIKSEKFGMGEATIEFDIESNRAVILG